MSRDDATAYIWVFVMAAITVITLWFNSGGA